jgi:hypothetical protein
MDELEIIVSNAEDMLHPSQALTYMEASFKETTYLGNSLFLPWIPETIQKSITTQQASFNWESENALEAKISTKIGCWLLNIHS